jgi:hypothetical protein
MPMTYSNSTCTEHVPQKLTRLSYSCFVSYTRRQIILLLRSKLNIISKIRATTLLNLLGSSLTSHMY